MPDPEFIHARPDDARGAVAAASGLPPFPRVTCRRCNADLTFLPAAARFCNRCGGSLPDGIFSSRADAPRHTDSAPSGARFSRPRWLFNLWFACVDDASGGRFPRAHSAYAGRSSMLLAYGKSLFNLGWRYEHAVGARRNLTEAARCYLKAARLGDPSATGRLTPVAPGAPADPPLQPPAIAPCPAGPLPFATVHRPHWSSPNPRVPHFPN